MRIISALLVASLLVAVPSASASGQHAYVEYSGPNGEFAGNVQTWEYQWNRYASPDLLGSTGCLGAILTVHQSQVDWGSALLWISSNGHAVLSADGVPVVSTAGPTFTSFPLTSSQVHIEIQFDFSGVGGWQGFLMFNLAGQVALEPAPCTAGPETIQELNAAFQDSREAARDSHKAGKSAVEPRGLNDYNRAYQESRLAALDAYKQAKQGLR